MTADETEFVLVTEYFHPDTASTGQLMTDLAVGLHDRGLDMTVYTGQPNYHSGPSAKQPTEGWHHGVRVRRLPMRQLRQSSLLRRLVNWTVFTLWVSIALLCDRPAKNRELLFVSNPPFLPLALWPVCRLRGWEYTYIVYDVYPDMAIEPGHLARDGPVARLWRRWHAAVFQAAQHIVALGDAMAARITEMAGPGFDPDTITIIHNWEDERFITPKSKDENWFSQAHGTVEDLTVLYSGNIGYNHDLETVIRAFTAFEDTGIQFLIIGEGDRKAEMQQLAADLGLLGDTVRFLPYQEWEILPYSLTCGDIMLVSVSEGMKGVCVSSKLYTAFATGQPVLVVSHPEDDEARTVQHFNAGIHVTHGESTGIVSAIEQWRTNPDLITTHGENARQAFEAHFTKDTAIDRYYQLLTGEHQLRSNRASVPQ